MLSVSNQRHIRRGISNSFKQCPYYFGTKTTDHFFIILTDIPSNMGCASDFYPPPVGEGGF